MSLSSLNVQRNADVTLGNVIKKENFTPVPEVDSQVIIIKPKGQLFNEISDQDFFRAPKLAFASRRKKIAHTLSSIKGDKEKTIDWLNGLSINPNARPQELSLEDWATIAKN